MEKMSSEKNKKKTKKISPLKDDFGVEVSYDQEAYRAKIKKRRNKGKKKFANPDFRAPFQAGQNFRTAKTPKTFNLALNHRQNYRKRDVVHEQETILIGKPEKMAEIDEICEQFHDFKTVSLIPEPKMEPKSKTKRGNGRKINLLNENSTKILEEINKVQAPNPEIIHSPETISLIPKKKWKKKLKFEKEPGPEYDIVIEKIVYV